MILYIIRHAQSTNNALIDQSYRVADPTLTELGTRQAELLAKHLAEDRDRLPDALARADSGYGLTQLWCSPMLRALQTAKPVADALGLQPQVWIDIHEEGGVWLNHGDDQGIVGHGGCSRRELLEAFPGYIIPPDISESGWWRYPGQESWPAFGQRVARVAAALRSWPPGGERVALITHGGFANGLLHALTDATSNGHVFFEHVNTGITAVWFREDGRVKILYMNRLDHLQLGLISS